jgi:hypothetical protein
MIIKIAIFILINQKFPQIIRYHQKSQLITEIKNHV